MKTRNTFVVVVVVVVVAVVFIGFLAEEVTAVTLTYNLYD